MCHYLLTWTSRFLDCVTFVDFLLWGMVTFQCGVWSVLVCYWCLHWVSWWMLLSRSNTEARFLDCANNQTTTLLPRNLLNVSHLLNGPFLYIHTALPGLSDQTTHLWTWARRFTNCTFFFFLFLCEWPFVSEAIYIFWFLFLFLHQHTLLISYCYTDQCIYHI